MGDEFKITEEIKLYMDYIKPIKNIQNEYVKLCTQILDKLIASLKSEFEDYNNYYINKSNEYIQIAKQSWNSDHIESRSGIHYEIISKIFVDILGKNKVNFKFYIHLENEVSKEKKNRIYERIKDKVEIEKSKPNLWLKISENNYNFSNEEEIKKSIKEIVDKMKEIDNKWNDEIDSWLNI